MKSIAKKNLKKFIKIVLKNKGSNILILFLILITTFLNLILPQITKQIIDEGIMAKQVLFLFQLGMVYLGVNLLLAACRSYLDFIYAKLNKKIVALLKPRIIRHISKLSGKYYANLKTGEIMNTIDNDMYIIESSGIQIFFDLLVNTVTAVIAFFYLAHMQVDLLFIVLIIQALIMLSQLFFAKVIPRQVQLIRHQASMLAGILQEYIANLVHIIMLNSKLFIFKKYFLGLREYARKAIKLDILISLNRTFSGFLSSLITVSIYGYGGYKVITNKMTFGELIAFQQYAGMFIGPLVLAINSTNRIQQMLVSINRVFAILDEPVEIQQNNSGYRPNTEFTANLELEDVVFSYDKQPVLKAINMKFEAGTVTGIAGSSGGGKSTIIKLLYRLWDIDSGRILINGIDIRDYNLMALRKQMAIIPQDVFLLNDTILHNLTMGNSRIQPGRIEYICQKIGIYDFIMEQPDGFQTMVGEKGVKLSGGQKQKVAFVRMLLSDAKIIILDEASSALDNHAEKMIWDNMRDLLVDKTVIVIAHRLSTIQEADNIYILSHGRVSEMGNHAYLLSLKGEYFKLWHSHDLACSS